MYYFIVNPNARSGAGHTIWMELRKELVRRKTAYQVQLTGYVGHAVKLAAEISRKGTADEPVSMVIVGGDGTLQEVLTGICDLDQVVLGFIPVGSGNDFCRSMRLPQDPLAALDCVLKRECITLMDVPYSITNGRKHRFGISTGMGFDAAVCQQVQAAPAKKLLNRLKLGKFVYLAVALRQLLFMNPVPVTLYLDTNRKFSYRKVYFTAVMNQKYEGGGFMFCPQAKSNDQVLDIIVVEGISRLKALFCLPTAFFGKHTKIKGVHILRARNIIINSAVPLAVHRDGESGGIHGEMSVSLEKKTLKIISPV